ncbi:ribonuclease M5 [Mariniplasma anaerobium]|uniref:Ribonuclease M5 n=1 Tax=Mariniplasma anaerobium TaxID=2735436 RepID=A0A7U9THU2_9MOLU|nr:ribonuclease M5 [Mariniplasma anaerobium]BCR35128.1 ribonuclease M5 [Mariniplasma anaerobium]
MRQKVFVVEGRNDFSRLKQLYPDIFILTTNGSAILDSTLDALVELDKTHDIILFLDPDYAGERIRKILSQKLTHVFHAFIEQDKAFSKNRKKIGVEHAKKEDIEFALKNIKMSYENTQSDIDMHFLYEEKLIGQKDSKNLRAYLSKELHLGHVNGKTLLDRLHQFNICKKQVVEVLKCNIKQKNDMDKIS